MTYRPTQQLILDWLRRHSPTYQVTTEELSTLLGLEKNKVKHAVARLFETGAILRTQGRPAKWSIAPQIVEAPPQGSPASLHGGMPQA